MTGVFPAQTGAPRGAPLGGGIPLPDQTGAVFGLAAGAGA